MKEKNNGKLTIVLIVILVALVLGLGGYLVYDKVLSNDKSNENANEKLDKQALLALGEKLVGKYYYIEKLDDSSKLWVTVNKVNTIYNEQCSTLYGEDVHYVSFNTTDGMVMGSCDETAQVYSYDAMNVEYRELFDGVLPKKQVRYDLMVFDYKELNNSPVFVKLNYPAGFNPFNKFLAVVKDVKTDGNKLIVDWASVYLEPDTDDGFSDQFDNYVVSEDRTIKYSADKVRSSEDEIVADMLKNHYDLVNKVQYVFELDNDNYILKEINNK